MARPMTLPKRGSGTRRPDPATFQGSRFTVGSMSHSTGAFLRRGDESDQVRAQGIETGSAAMLRSCREVLAKIRGWPNVAVKTGLTVGSRISDED